MNIRKMIVAIVITLIMTVSLTGLVYGDAYIPPPAGSDYAADYDVIVDASDGGVNMRYGPGTEYEKVLSNMIPNGEILHVTWVRSDSRGLDWGATTYEGSEGWICLTEVAVYTGPSPEEIAAAEKAEAEKKAAEEKAAAEKAEAEKKAAEEKAAAEKAEEEKKAAEEKEAAEKAEAEKKAAEEKEAAEKAEAEKKAAEEEAARKASVTPRILFVIALVIIAIIAAALILIKKKQ